MPKLVKDPEWKQLVQLFSKVKDPEIMNQMFYLFFTMGEREDLLGRYQIIRTMLMTDLTQREISEKLGQSISKITMGSKAVQVISDELKEYLLKEMK